MPQVPSQERSHLHKDTLRHKVIPPNTSQVTLTGQQVEDRSLIMLLQSRNRGTQVMQGSCGAAHSWIRHCNSSFCLKFRLRGPHTLQKYGVGLSVILTHISGHVMVPAGVELDTALPWFETNFYTKKITLMVQNTCLEKTSSLLLVLLALPETCFPLG